MIQSKTLFVAIILWIPGVALAISEWKCPIAKDAKNANELILGKIKAAQSCVEANTLISNCSLAGAGDIERANVASKTCEKDFKSFTEDEAKAYKALINRCKTKYKGLVGSMFLSSQAFCELSVAKLFSDLFQPVEDEG